MHPSENNPPYRVMIVDDESDARELLSELVSENPRFELVALANGVSQALPLVINLKPDLLFLDIQMPERSGFELVQELRGLGLETPVIFVTAFNQFAIEAIKASALDYLLKPVSPFDLAKALQKFITREQKEDYFHHLDELLKKMQATAPVKGKLRFNYRTGFLLIDPEDILYAEADGNYTTLHLRNDKTETISANLGQVEKTLPEGAFRKISRSVIINTTYLAKVDRASKTCTLACGNTTITLKTTGMGKGL